jgi:hypothetical protein
MAGFFDFLGGDGYMQWNFSRPDVEPLGVIDNKSMNTWSHLDYENLSLVYTSQADRLARGESIFGQGRATSDCVEIVASPSVVALEGSTCQEATGSATLHSLSDVPIAFQIESDASWLSVLPASGTIEVGGEPRPLSLTATCPAEPGNYEAMVTIRGSSDSEWTSGHETVERLFVELRCEDDHPEWVAQDYFYWPTPPQAGVYLEGDVGYVTDGDDASYFAAVLPAVWGGIYGPELLVRLYSQDSTINEITVKIHVDRPVTEADVEIHTFIGPMPISRVWEDQVLLDGAEFHWDLEYPGYAGLIGVRVDALRYHQNGATDNAIGLYEVEVFGECGP